MVEGVRLSDVVGIAELSDQIRRANDRGLVVAVMAFRGRKPGAFDGIGNALAVEWSEALDPLYRVKLRSIDMVGHQAGVGRATRQGHLAARLIDYKTVHVVIPEQAAYITDVVEQAGYDDMGVIIRGQIIVQRATAEDVVSREGHQQRVLDIVVQRVAVSDAFERDASRRRHDLPERLRGPEAAAHIGAEEAFQGIGRQLR